MPFTPRGRRGGATAHALLLLLERGPVPLPRSGDHPHHADAEQRDPEALQGFVEAARDVCPQLLAAVGLLGGDAGDRPRDGQQVRLDTYRAGGGGGCQRSTGLV